MLVVLPLALVRAPSGGQIDGLREALTALVQYEQDQQEEAAAYLERRGRRDAIPAMIDALRYVQFRTPALVRALEKLSGQQFGENYRPWAEWMVREGVRGPDIYGRWKADFLARLDPRFGMFLDPDRPATHSRAARG